MRVTGASGTAAASFPLFYWPLQERGDEPSSLTIGKATATHVAGSAMKSEPCDTYVYRVHTCVLPADGVACSCRCRKCLRLQNVLLRFPRFSCLWFSSVWRATQLSSTVLTLSKPRQSTYEHARIRLDRTKYGQHYRELTESPRGPKPLTTPGSVAHAFKKNFKDHLVQALNYE